jgi:RNA polymerase sigma factor (sigma-70 family)
MAEDRTTPPFEPMAAVLAARIQSGDATAEDELVRLVQPSVVRLLRWRMRDPDVVGELANDVLIAVVCALRARKLQDTTKVLPFVRGIARNVTNYHFRVRRSRPPEEPLPPDLASADMHDGVERRERDVAVRRGLASLEHADREILLRTLVDGLKPGEIARDLGVSPEVVRTRKSRALPRLLASTRQADA